MTPARERLLFAALLALHLALLLLVPAFPSQDGASHVEAAYQWRRYADPDAAIVREYYVRNPTPEPNLLGHLALMALLAVAPPTVAEKILVAALVVLLPLSVRYALKSVATDAAWLSVLAFPFVYSWPLHMGFFNFVCGLPLFFFVVGYWIRHRADMRVRRVIDLAALALVLWTAHVVPLVLAFAVVACWVLVERRAVGRTIVAFAPAALLLAAFVWRKQPTPSEAPPFAELVRGLATLESLVSFRDVERIPSTLLVALFVVLLAGGLRSWRWAGRRSADGLLVAAALVLVLYFVSPRRMAGGAYVSERLVLFPFFVVSLWLASRDLAPRLARFAHAAGAAIALAACGVHVSTYVALRGQIAEYLSAAPHVPADHTLLPLAFAPQGWGLSQGGPRVKVFLHTGSYLAAERGALNLANYEGNYVHFPMVFADARNPFVLLGREQGLEGDPPCVDVEAYERETMATVDVVLVWGLREHERAEPCTARLLEHLERAYTLTFVSEPRRLARVYVRADLK